MLFTKRKHKVDAKKLKKSQIKAVTAEDMKKLKQVNNPIDDENDDVENENGVIENAYISSIPIKDADGNFRFAKAVLVEDKSSKLLKDTNGKVRIFKATIVEDK